MLAAALIASVTTIATLGTNAWNSYSRAHNWREHEYRKLTSLRAGFSVNRFEAVLGPPLFRRGSKSGKFFEETFQGRDYWVQAVTDGQGTVKLYSVTSCSASFRPTFAGIFRVTLQRSTFGSTAPAGSDEITGVMADYFGAVATANAHFYEVADFGNPSDYKTYAWGLNDACVTSPSIADLWKTGYVTEKSANYEGPASVHNAALQRFRAHALVNTYAETDPFTDIKMLEKSFQVGADRLLIRTAR